MSISRHNELVGAGDIVGYGGSYAPFYGYKLLQKVYVEQVGAYVWLGQYGTVNKTDNKFAPDNGGKTITVLTSGDLKGDYHSVWTPDTEYKKGDILIGKENGKNMLFVYLSESHVERLTPRNDFGLDGFGYSSLSDYQTNFGPLTIHTVQGTWGTGMNAKKFSAL